MAFKEKKDEEKPEEAKKAKEEPKPKKPVSHVKDFEEDMVYLFQFTRSPQVGAQLNLDTPEAAANRVLQKVTSEANPKVCNHGEGPY